MAKIVEYVRRHHIGLLALFMALSGTAYAASLPRNSVGTTQLKRNAVTSSKVRDRSLLARDFRRGQLPSGERGPRGLTGGQGPAGPPGARGPSDVFGASPADLTVSANAGPPITLGSLGLGPGSYVIFGSTVISSGADLERGVRCGLGFPGLTTGVRGTADRGDVDLAPGTTSAGGSQATLTLLGPVRLDAADTIVVECLLSGPSGATGQIAFSDIDIGAVQVGTIH